MSTVLDYIIVFFWGMFFLATFLGIFVNYRKGNQLSAQSLPQEEVEMTAMQQLADQEAA
ncbi:MAG: hypothetical protein AAF206_12750 [Bacteroidota bacterium]